MIKASTFVSKQDMSGIRYIMTKMEEELKQRVFDMQTPFKTSEGNEVQLMTDCLLASFRLNSRKVVNESFTTFLNADQSVFKLVLVNTLQRVVDEGAPLFCRALSQTADPLLISPEIHLTISM
jgi:hypothetical protein